MMSMHTSRFSPKLPTVPRRVTVPSSADTAIARLSTLGPAGPGIPGIRAASSVPIVGQASGARPLAAHHGLAQAGITSRIRRR